MLMVFKKKIADMIGSEVVSGIDNLFDQESIARERAEKRIEDRLAAIEKQLRLIKEGMMSLAVGIQRPKINFHNKRDSKGRFAPKGGVVETQDTFSFSDYDEGSDRNQEESS